MKCRTIIYVNNEDPRVFVYKHRKWKWFGVTLNFAYLKSFVILLITLASFIIPMRLISIWRNETTAAISIIFPVLWLLALIWYYYRMAAKDLAQYPGKLSDR